jgi:hypothetical protein
MSDELARGVAALVAAELEVERLEAALKAANKVVYDLETVTLPKMFDDAGEVATTLADGTIAKKGLRITGSLPKVDEDAPVADQMLQEQARKVALAWLMDNDCGPFVKAKVEAIWDKGDSEKARKYAAELQRQDNSVVVKLKEDIHPSTLQAEARRRLGAGKPIPLATLGLVALTAVRITKRPKQ